MPIAKLPVVWLTSLRIITAVCNCVLAAAKRQLRFKAVSCLPVLISHLAKLGMKSAFPGPEDTAAACLMTAATRLNTSALRCIRSLFWESRVRGDQPHSRSASGAKVNVVARYGSSLLDSNSSLGQFSNADAPDQGRKVGIWKGIKKSISGRPPTLELPSITEQSGARQPCLRLQGLG